jgi:hypothetical protein
MTILSLVEEGDESFAHVGECPTAGCALHYLKHALTLYRRADGIARELAPPMGAQRMQQFLLESNRLLIDAAEETEAAVRTGDASRMRAAEPLMKSAIAAQASFSAEFKRMAPVWSHAANRKGGRKRKR